MNEEGARWLAQATADLDTAQIRLDSEITLDALRDAQIVLEFVRKVTTDAGNDSNDAPTADLG